jgi:hypothetical protein
MLDCSWLLCFLTTGLVLKSIEFNNGVYHIAVLALAQPGLDGDLIRATVRFVSGFGFLWVRHERERFGWF